jgi:DNA mismatch repair protein MutL
MGIRKLSTHLVNKIAAGEVIERPASVVKELVENALDAGATRIEVTVEEGGKDLIAVTDDGGGIAPDDVAMAFAPHATSKLAAEDDLFDIRTMGFRGEALASIASISHAHIRTRQATADTGWEVRASGETVEAPAPCPAGPGTTITVRDLFFNTPARRKFLRTTSTEFGHVTEQLTRLALPQPNVAFVLRHNTRESLNLPAVESTLGRIRDLFNDELADSLLPLIDRGSPGDVRIRGYLAPPAAARSSAKWQYVFLNGRYIRDRLISHAIREAYRGLVMPVKSPVVFLFIEIDPGAVDVNVHPTKIEVRFRNSNAVYGELLATLRETLNRADLRGQANLDAAESDAASSSADAARQDSLREAMADFFKRAPAPAPRLNFPAGDGPRPAASAPSPRSSSPGALPLGPSRTQHSPDTQPTGQADLPPAEESHGAPPSYSAGPAPLLQIHDTYIVTQTQAGLVIVDQHALHERILYNRLHARLLAEGLTGQQLLIPEPIEVTESEAAVLDERAELLDRLGIEVARFGPGSVALQRFPTLLAERNVQAHAFLRELLDTLGEDETADDERLIEEVLAVMACKAAVKAGDPLSDAEMAELLAQADDVEKKTSCPHGRPTIIELSLVELEKQFKRRV